MVKQPSDRYPKKTHMVKGKKSPAPFKKCYSKRGGK
jgi:hypothetical protein